MSFGGGWIVGQAIYPLLKGKTSALLLLFMEDLYLNPYYQSQFAGEPVQVINIIPARARFSAAKILRRLSLFAVGVSLLVFLILYLPSVVYFIVSGAKLPSLLVRQPQKTEAVVLPPAPVVEKYQPRLDPSLPLDNMVVIPSVGISTKINEQPVENYEEALKVGVWRVPDFGTPYDRQLPVILAAHRYGYLRWSVPYRLKNSFYNLPKVKVGDTVEVVWRQRKYIYEVYAEGKGEEIADYSADLVLYTCESLTSPVRIFKYARLLRV